jgi:hypothetical protein
MRKFLNGNVQQPLELGIIPCSKSDTWEPTLASTIREEVLHRILHHLRRPPAGPLGRGKAPQPNDRSEGPLNKLIGIRREPTSPQVLDQHRAPRQRQPTLWWWPDQTLSMVAQSVITEA